MQFADPPVRDVPWDADARWGKTPPGHPRDEPEGEAAKRISLGESASSRGFPTSARCSPFVAVHPVHPVHPKGGDLRGDELSGVDLRPGARVPRIVGKVKLEQLTKGPVAGTANTYPPSTLTGPARTIEQIAALRANGQTNSHPSRQPPASAELWTPGCTPL